jgi:hypothetical protein
MLHEGHVTFVPAPLLAGANWLTGVMLEAMPMPVIHSGTGS